MSRASHDNRRVLFEAATPLSLAIFWPVYERLRRDARLEIWFTTSDGWWTADQVFGASGITERVISPRDAHWKKCDAYINTDF